MNKRAFALLSGGLDSIVAVKVIQAQGIEVIGVHFASLFFDRTKQPGVKNGAERAADMLGIELIVLPKDVSFMRMIQTPRFGYGSAINPCMDCRIYYLNVARTLMSQYDVSFVITGEVLGQRPKSQKHDGLAIVERESGIPGLIVRPLSAQLLAPTIPEKEGLIDRNRLCKISGRCRKEQMALAAKYGITEYPNPAGGCQLTEKEFVPKVEDLFRYGFDHNDDIALLTCGRHFRFNEKTKIIVVRNAVEAAYLRGMVHEDDTFLEPVDWAGPVALVKKNSDPVALDFAAALMRFHSKEKENDALSVQVRVGEKKREDRVCGRVDAECVELFRLT